MNPIEAIAVVFGIVSVWLNARQNVLGWATGLVNVALYTWIFFKGQLFALMGLQVVFFVISLYGWYQWIRGGQQHAGVAVSRIPVRLGATLVAGSVVLTAALGWALKTYTGDQQPYVDSGLSIVSMAGQWMMARKYLETWGVWIGVNLVAVPLFLVRAEYPTALQYTVFLGLGISGLVQWRRSLASS